MLFNAKNTEPMFFFVSVVVSISNSVLSILTANFPVRIEKKEVCMIVLFLTGMFSVNIEKTKFA